ncbi:MAG: hypothetical protein GY754_15070 [bacterium]|nr:hypothetical protein [bacterium]
MPEDRAKMSDFVNHLLQNPNIKNEPLLIGEGLLLNFIVQNMGQLKQTFKTPQFFPNLEWSQVLQLLISDLYERVSQEVLPVIDEFIDTADLEILNRLISGSPVPIRFQQEKLHAFILAIFRNKDVRYRFNSVINILQYGILERYLTEIFDRRKFIYNEIVRVQKTNLECGEYIIFAKVMLMVRNAAYMKYPLGSGGNNMNLDDALKMPGKIKRYIADLSRTILNELPILPEHEIQLAIKSNLKENMTDLEDGICRLLYILSARYHSYKPVTKVDRGAESPDKSWFAIAMKNAEHYGYNRKMVEELYRIAGDNNW